MKKLLITLNITILFSCSWNIYSVFAQNNDIALLKDINHQPTVYGADGAFVTLNGIAYYASTINNRNDTSVLMRTNGTAEGTYSTGVILTLESGLIVYQNSIYMGGYDPDDISKIALLRYNGTGEATVVAYLNVSQYFHPFRILNNKLYFTTNAYYTANELWITDGSSEGTYKVADVEIDMACGTGELNNIFYFCGARKVYNGNTVWRSDGTDSGTHAISDICLNCDRSITCPTTFATLNNHIYFVAMDSNYVSRLFQYDGNNFNVVTKKISRPTYLTESKNELFLFGNSSNGNGQSLWKSNGTDSGTVVVNDLGPGFFHFLTSCNDFLYFVESNSKSGAAIWRSDGTESGTFALSGSNSIQKAYRIDNFISGDSGRAYAIASFANNYAYIGYALIRCYKDSFLVVHAFSNSLNPILFSFNQYILMSAADRDQLNQLWISDGTAGGTNKVGSNGASTGSSSYYPGSLSSARSLRVDSILYFFADDGINGFEVWKTDGKSNNTSLLDNAYGQGYLPNDDYVEVKSMRRFRNKLLFTMDLHKYYNFYNNGSPNPDSTALFISNGNKTSALGLWSGAIDFTPAIFDSIFYFIQSTQIWKSNGTHEGTHSVVTLPYSGMFLTRCNNKMVFQDYSTSSGYELWVSDGTARASNILADINPGSKSSYPNSFNTFGGTTYFLAIIGDSLELWTTNGKAVSKITALSTNTDYSTFNSDIYTKANMIKFKDEILIFEYDFTTGERLWKTDGTKEGTVVLHQFSGSNDWFWKPFEVKGIVYFISEDSAYGEQIWRTDGTTNGTFRVSNIDHGLDWDRIFTVYPCGDNILISTNNYSRNFRIFLSDGTEGGTQQLSLIYKGDSVKTAFVLNTINGKAVITGYTQQLGWESFSLDLDCNNSKDARLTLQQSSHAVTTIFPNPSLNTFTLLATEDIAKVVVFDLSGWLVETLQLKEGTIVFGEKYPSGIYFVKTFFNNGTLQTMKVVKQ